MAFFEGRLADLVLLDMVGSAQADRPAVGGLEAGAAVGPAADVGAFDRETGAARDRAGVPADPGAVGRALPCRCARRSLAVKPLRELQSGHDRSSVWSRGAGEPEVLPAQAAARPRWKTAERATAATGRQLSGRGDDKGRAARG